MECKQSFSRRLLLIAAGGMIFATSLLMSAQADTSKDVAKADPASGAYVPTMTFDVASIRQSPEADSYTISGYFQPHSSSLRVVNWDAMNLLSLAYGVRHDQIVGMPNWHAMFDIQAKSDDTTQERFAKLDKDQEKLEQQHMLQVLLADRFKLKTHWETREGLTYNLVVLKNGPKMSVSKGEPPSPELIKKWGGRPIPPIYEQGDSRAGFDLVAHACSMNNLTDEMAALFDHPVADKTGLTGKYDFVLRFHETRLSDREADDMDPLPTLDVAIQDQLGLKLEPAKGSEQVLVIDQIEKPSEN